MEGKNFVTYLLTEKDAKNMNKRPSLV